MYGVKVHAGESNNLTVGCARTLVISKTEIINRDLGLKWSHDSTGICSMEMIGVKINDKTRGTESQ
jgi:hypothetical protein